MKIHLVGAEIFHENRRTNIHDEANSCFSKFCEKRLKMTELYRTYCTKLAGKFFFLIFYLTNLRM